MLRINKIRIINFRSFKNSVLTIGKDLVIAGPNNSGKSNFLYAIYIALSRYSNIGEFDFYNQNYQEDILIDIVLKNYNDFESIEFEEVWYDIFHEMIVPHDNSDSIIVRFRGFYDKESDTFKTKRTLITDFDNLNNEGSTLPKYFYDCISVYYFDSQRDISDEIKRKNSNFSKMINSIRSTIPKKDKDKINNNLIEINKLIMSSFPRLSEIEKKLSEVGNILNENNIVKVYPVPNNIDDLKESIQLLLHYNNNVILPISLYGDGTKSWLSILSLSKSIEIIKSNINLSFLPYASIVLVEEPEAHLHPTAQMKVLNEIMKINGHKIISTHSGDVLCKTEINKIAVMKNENSESELAVFNDEIFEENEICKIYNQIIDTKSSIILSGNVILVEGITDVLLLKFLFRLSHGYDFFDIGYTIVNCEGVDNIPFFFRFLKNLNKNVIVFADNDSQHKIVEFYRTNRYDRKKLYFTSEKNIDSTIGLFMRYNIIKIFKNNYGKRYIISLINSGKLNHKIYKYLDNNKSIYPYKIRDLLSNYTQRDIHSSLPPCIRKLFKNIVKE